MLCETGKDTYPDLQTALVARDALIERWANPLFAYKCYQSCQKWHLTTNTERGFTDRRMLRWNNLLTEPQRRQYDDRLRKAQQAMERGG